jgi:ribosomal protein S18 acetylase RimI-like enzyme
MNLRPLAPADQAVLWELLHVALWDPPPAGLRPREILHHPAVRIYAEDWGRRPGDVGVIGEIEGEIAGACWMRLVTGGEGLGYVDDETPQLGIALFPKFQHQGHGEPLMLAALEAARLHGYKQVSLTVHPENPAIRLYERCGFVKRDTRNTYHLMVCSLVIPA